MENNFEIEVGEVQQIEIDYSKTPDELIAYFDGEIEKIQKGEREQGNFELVMLGYAIDFLFFVKEATDIVLDFEEAVIPTFDAVLDALYRNYCEQAPTREDFEDMVKKATGFLCVVIWKNLGCGYFGSNLGIGVQINGTNAFVMNRVGRRLQNGSEDDIVSFYNYLKTL